MLHLTQDQLARVVAPVEEMVSARRQGLLDLSPTDFSLWLHHPVTVQVMAWLEDYRDSLLRDAVRAFLQGDMEQLMLSEHRGRARMCSELVVLQWADILRWYFGDAVPPREERV